MARASSTCLPRTRRPAKGQHPGRASLKNLGHCLKALHKVVEDEDLQSLALPRLATGVGGLDWELVRPLLDQHLGQIGIPSSSTPRFTPDRKPSNRTDADARQRSKR